MDTIELQPNPEILAIIRLYLEKRETFDAEEKALFLKVIASLAFPFVSSDERKRSILDVPRRIWDQNGDQARRAGNHYEEIMDSRTAIEQDEEAFTKAKHVDQRGVEIRLPRI
jgi:hypothetical protein